MARFMLLVLGLALCCPGLFVLDLLDRVAQQQDAVTVTILAPADRSVTYSQSLEVLGKASTKSPEIGIDMVLVIVAGVPKKASLSRDGTFRAMVNLLDGVNSVLAVAIATNREIGSARISVTLQRPPEAFFHLSDDFNVRPNPRWDTSDGNWTSINGQFAPLEERKDQLYWAKLNLGRSIVNFTMSIDVNIRKEQDAFVTVGVPDGHQIKLGFIHYYSYPYGSRVSVLSVYGWLDKHQVAYKENIGFDVTPVKIELKDKSVKIYIRGEKLVELFDPDYAGMTAVWLGSQSRGGGRVYFDNFSLKETP